MYKTKNEKRQPRHTLSSPLVEALGGDVALHALVLDDELHPLEEGGGDRGRMLAQQDVYGLGHRVAQLAALADGALAALGILAVGQAICGRSTRCVADFSSLPTTSTRTLAKSVLVVRSSTKAS